MNERFDLHVKVTNSFPPFSVLFRVAFGYEGEDTTISVIGQGSEGIAHAEHLLQDKSVRVESAPEFARALAPCVLSRLRSEYRLHKCTACSSISRCLLWL